LARVQEETAAMRKGERVSPVKVTVDEPKKAASFKLRVSTLERLRAVSKKERLEQVAILESALEKWFTDYDDGGVVKIPRQR